MGNCATETAALRGLLETEYAGPGRAFYAAAKDNSDKLEWYPGRQLGSANIVDQPVGALDVEMTIRRSTIERRIAPIQRRN